VVALNDSLDKKAKRTVEKLTSLGIKIWMITGDKSNAAFEISKKCSIIPRNEKLINIDEFLEKKDSEDIFSLLLNKTSIKIPKSLDFGSELAKTEKFDLLGLIFEELYHKKYCRFHLLVKGQTAIQLYMKFGKSFSKFCNSAKSCVFARSTPSQKAIITKIAKESKGKVLAIGDGGNDVSMLRTAHVSVGIRGNEGRQAANAADISCDSFSALDSLITFHGINIYRKKAQIIKFNFYKSIFFCLISIFYGYYSCFSAKTLFSPSQQLIYNSVLSIVMLCSAFDLEVSKFESPVKIKRKYESHLQNNIFSMTSFFGWFFRGIFHAFMTLWISVLLYKYAYCLNEVGVIIFITFIFCCIFTIFIESKFYSPVLYFSSVLVVLISLIALLLFSMVKFEDISEYRAAINVLLNGRVIFNSVNISLLLCTFSKFYSILWKKIKRKKIVGRFMKEPHNPKRNY